MLNFKSTTALLVLAITVSNLTVSQASLPHDIHQTYSGPASLQRRSPSNGASSAVRRAVRINNPLDSLPDLLSDIYDACTQESPAPVEKKDNKPASIPGSSLTSKPDSPPASKPASPPVSATASKSVDECEKKKEIALVKFRDMMVEKATANENTQKLWEIFQKLPTKEFSAFLNNVKIAGIDLKWEGSGEHNEDLKVPISAGRGKQ
ncbi:hypothetical protein BJ085DRAFT_36195 [Dimargaris cristalligena]|uniref:RxLR effector protein n=1 Tax=Dimargaris cristalligena TaxID=215637 RepID=A0A4P9ZP61_9FUNG|nr:hypothetical protein BJ085DRAFT_36195 [Dimargaris cristalligena]|eukprot:RKP34421.1 hypothetical protein BJ085DRAFT_36195 [Dimargaris cristalligena]